MIRSPEIRLTPAMRWLIAVMAVREPLRWQTAESGSESAFFPGDPHWPLVGIPLRTVRALYGRGLIVPTRETSVTAFWDMEPTQAAVEAAGWREIASAQKWNDQRNLSHRRDV